MGIPRFFGYLCGQDSGKNTKCIVEGLPELDSSKKYDYLFLDYQSLCYSALSVFSGEINYFIRLSNYIKHKATTNAENVYTQNKYILEYILNKYSRYFTTIKSQNSSFPMFLPELTGDNKYTLDSIVEFMNDILGAHLKDQTIVWDELVNQVIDLTVLMAETHVDSTEKFSNTFIFFDGIPSLAKVKEQLGRRVFPEVISTIKSNLYKVPSDTEFMSKTITSKLLSSSAPIGVDTYIVNKLRSDLASIDDSTKGKFYINDVLRYGEAEHQLMKYLYTNLDTFRTKKILLASPDADLILLGLINTTREISIDILRTNGIDDKHHKFYPQDGRPEYKKLPVYRNENRDKTHGILSPYKKTFDYIDCNCIKIMLALDTDQKVLDISYLLLLLGDDFIPIIPSLSVNDIPLIISTYDELILTDSTNTIVQTSGGKYFLTHDNLKKYIILLSSKKGDEAQIYRDLVRSQNFKRGKGFGNIMKSFNNYKSWLFLDPAHTIDFDKIEKIYYLDKGWFAGDTGDTGDTGRPTRPRDSGRPLVVYKSLIKDGSTDLPTYNPELVSAYLKGCQFVFDIYLNNEVRNYKWYFNFDEGPTLSNLVKYLTETSGDISLSFDYYSLESPEERAKYLNVETYKAFVEDNKKQIFKEIIEKMDTREDLTTFEANHTDIKRRQFTYENSDKIFDCNGIMYFNKCIELTTLTSYDPQLRDIDVNMLGGKYYEKYMKYKSKYLKLREKINKKN